MGRRAGLVHHDGRESEDCECEDRSKRQIDERDREAARDPRLPQPTHDRVEEEGDERSHEEEKHHVTQRPRHHPDEQQHERQAYELHPARDLDPGLRGGARHASDGSEAPGPRRVARLSLIHI